MAEESDASKQHGASTEVDPSVVVTSSSDGQRSSVGSILQSLATLPSAPCFKQSLGIGCAGGLCFGSLRLFTSRQGISAFSWGATVGAMLAGTTCGGAAKAVLRQSQTMGSLAHLKGLVGGEAVTAEEAVELLV
ncbi:hypothetical protein AB1Y20_014945 [Prymnesium parvum]|uniref:Uncharacterized protein n=1 Tax=Prymnesium parvum TaxID=97485 RepID=A0AB34JWY1_PRYPA